VRLCLLSALIAVAGCLGPGLWTDGSSVSVGTTSTGALRAATLLPPRGDGYYVPKRWRDRQRSHGTDELVQLLVRSARRVNLAYPGSLLGVADLSPRAGGPSSEHRSHRSGRDVDLVLYHLDEKGKPARPEEMVNFDNEGLSVTPTTLPASQPAAIGVGLPTPGPATTATPQAGTAPCLADSAGTGDRACPLPAQPRKLDIERTWALIRAFVTDPKVSVQWIFIGAPLARLLLLHARKRHEPEYIIERAAAVLHHANAHMDHAHVRVFCAPSDRAQGCIDRGPSRWLKKEIKYLDSPALQGADLPVGLTRLTLRPLLLF